MDENAKKIIPQIESILTEITNLIKKTENVEGDMTPLAYILYSKLHTDISALIDRSAPKSSSYYRSAQVFLVQAQQSIMQGYFCNDSLASLYGILDSLKAAYSSGYLQTINEQINAEIFSDFLEMAEYFLSQGDQYKHPAAFLIGGVLEEHLRKLAIKNEIPTVKDNDQFRHAEDVNVDLRKKGIYTENEKKSITAWLGLRNDVDHAHWEKYSQEKVEVMLKDVRRIINQYPA
jgi:hypothetical protein